MANIDVKGKTILVTGGTGSFGHHIVDRLLKSRPKEIRIFSRDEKKQDDMRFQYKDQPSIKFIIGDVRDSYSVDKVMSNVDVVFHAAALKQVPSCEYNILEGIKTNILGAQNVVDAAFNHNIEKVIAVSTDKAVEPVNVMGMTKAIQERIIVSANRLPGRTRFCCVRYGNVLGSRGSVVPLFKKQIANKEPLTLTHKDMTRFILTLNEAINLVFTAYNEMIGGEIFVNKMPAHTVHDLAEVMLDELKRAKKEIKITGIRPGEKIHETLVSPVESMRTITKSGYFIILPQIEIEHIEKKYPDYRNANLFRFSSDSAERLSKKQLKDILKKEGWI